VGVQGGVGRGAGDDKRLHSNCHQSTPTAPVMPFLLKSASHNAAGRCPGMHASDAGSESG
jgi:hypothetical protein